MKIKKNLNYDYLTIYDDKLDVKYYGGSQEWYKSFWKRKAGCGPTTASTIVMYENRYSNIFDNNYNKKEFIDLMNNMWEYITPKEFGVNKTDIYINGFSRYIKENSIKLSDYKCINFMKNNLKDFSKKDVFIFLSEAIDNNHPVAFLNLDSGEEKALDSWHWVSIVGILFDEETDKLRVTIVDECVIKEIDLGLWLDTTSLGGGLVYYK